ncbi:hypothetical protein [Gloeobacter kilaueensis]|uniref:Uncharacterized protein n=1 Tax=Gloeobacter kilaueensis (strain ATCC BAA-2537 / CCAP 1431/1 / ULC 316 / JS1) TaxID=1183438 RepID=U5QF23_GLOK1|nr:hypothetical protein [Gloeobacter kilaueensis]AGY57521.1 hypothetical protein GKIL_1275 [Gloeobacter kilaueensis JS1]
MTSPTHPPESTDFPAARRIAAGVGWGILWGGGISAVIFPLVGANLTLGLILATIIVVSVAMGISLYWNAAREPCPNCSTVFTATPNGSRCPNCGERVRAVERQMIRR